MTELWSVTTEDVGAARRVRKAADKAAAFRHDPVMEDALRLREVDPHAFAELAPGTKIAVGTYAEARDAAVAAGLPVEPSA